MITYQRKAHVDGCDHGRYYDGLAQRDDGTWVGIEVKSGSGSYSPEQKIFDNLVSPSNPARVRLDDGRVIEIVKVEHVKVPKQN